MYLCVQVYWPVWRPKVDIWKLELTSRWLLQPLLSLLLLLLLFDDDVLKQSLAEPSLAILVRLSGQQAPGIHHSLVLGLQARATIPCFYVNVRDLNSDTHDAYIVSSLSTVTPVLYLIIP